MSRRQVLAAGFGNRFVEQRLRRREWARVHRGVYVDHTGPLTWDQRAWAAVLFYWPAALSHASALTVAGVRTTAVPRSGGITGRGRSSAADGNNDIHVAVDQRRRVEPVTGVRVHRVTGMPALVQPLREPPRLRLERTLLDTAAEASDDAAALAVLADACQTGRTTAGRLAEQLRDRRTLRRRRFLLGVLEDVAAGAYSVLERAYLSGVERPHGLPTGDRQRRVAQGKSAAYRDVEYLKLHTVVELDGRLGHELQADRWDDLDRDIDSIIAGDVTLRLGWRQVLSPCRAAGAVGRMLQARGWTGQLRRCGPSCTVRKGGLSALLRDNPPSSGKPPR